MAKAIARPEKSVDKLIYIRTADPALGRLAELILTGLEGVAVQCGSALPPPETVLTVLDTALEEEGAVAPVLRIGRSGNGDLPFPFPRELLLEACRTLLNTPRPKAALTFLAGRRCRLPGGQLVDLTDLEWQLLRLLRKAEGAPVSRRVLCHALWDREEADNLLNVTLCHLRKKIESDGVKRLTTHRGAGIALTVAM